MHQLVMGMPPKRKIWDHKNRNPLDNRKRNLRHSTRSQNGANRGTIRRDCVIYKPAVYKGVYWRKDRKKWVAQIGFRMKTRYLGAFSDPVDAARAYDRAAFRYFRQFAVTNFQIKRYPRLCKTR